MQFVHHEAHWLITTATPGSCPTLAWIVVSRIWFASRALAERTAPAPRGLFAGPDRGCDTAGAGGGLGLPPLLEAAIATVTAASTTRAASSAA